MLIVGLPRPCKQMEASYLPNVRIFISVASSKEKLNDLAHNATPHEKEKAKTILEDSLENVSLRTTTGGA